MRTQLKDLSQDARGLFADWLEAENKLITEDDLEKQYNDMLDECFPVKIGSLEFNGSDALKELDPIAYRCGFSDYTGSGDYYEADEIVSNCYTEEPLEDLLDEFIDTEEIRYCEKHRLYEPASDFNTPEYDDEDGELVERDQEDWSWCDDAHKEFDAMIDAGGAR